MISSNALFSNTKESEVDSDEPLSVRSDGESTAVGNVDASVFVEDAVNDVGEVKDAEDSEDDNPFG